MTKALCREIKDDSDKKDEHEPQCWLPSYPWFKVAQAVKLVTDNTTF